MFGCSFLLFVFCKICITCCAALRGVYLVLIICLVICCVLFIGG